MADQATESPAPTASPSPLAGEGRGGGASLLGTEVLTGTTPTPDPFPQGGREPEGGEAARDRPARKPGSAGRGASRLIQAGFLAGLVALWYLASTRWGVNRLLLPNPVAVYDNLLDILRSGEFVDDLETTLGELAAAFAISAVGGVTLGYLISRSRYWIEVFEPLFAAIYSIPIILFLPLFVLFFGLGPPSKIALGAAISFFPIVINTIAGFGHVDRLFLMAARSMGASDYHLFRHVLLPAASPVILTGLRMGFTTALLSIIGSETLASLAGLGHRIVHLAEAMEMARMFAYIVFVIAIALTLNAIVSRLEARGKRD